MADSRAPDRNALVAALEGASAQTEPGALARIADALMKGAQGMIEGPGRAFHEGMTPEQMTEWAAPMALGMTPLSRVPGAAPRSGPATVTPEAAPPSVSPAYARAEEALLALERELATPYAPAQRNTIGVPLPLGSSLWTKYGSDFNQYNPRLRWLMQSNDNIPR